MASSGFRLSFLPGSGFTSDLLLLSPQDDAKGSESLFPQAQPPCASSPPPSLSCPIPPNSSQLPPPPPEFSCHTGKDGEYEGGGVPMPAHSGGHKGQGDGDQKAGCALARLWWQSPELMGGWVWPLLGCSPGAILILFESPRKWVKGTFLAWMLNIHSCQISSGQI